MKTHVPECDALDTYVVYKPFIIIFLSFLVRSVFHLEISYHVLNNMNLYNLFRNVRKPIKLIFVGKN